MKLSTKRPLALSRETVRELAGRDLDGIEGGIEPTPPIYFSFNTICGYLSIPNNACSAEKCI
jgi:hypothetical protein